MALPNYPAASVKISWANDGTFTGEHDDVTAAVPDNPGLSVDRGRDQARSLAPPMVPAADFALLNDDRTYSQENPASPVYQLVVPGRAVSIAATHGTRRTYRSHTGYRETVPYRGRAPYPLLRGLVDTIDQDATLGQRRVSFACLGLMGALRGRKVTIPVQHDIRTDQALGILLDAVNWPADLRRIAVGDTTLLYWWADERDAWDAAVELLASEGPGALYEAGDGSVVFENRNYRTLADRSTTTQGTFYDRARGQRTRYGDHVGYRSHTPYRGGGGLYFTALTYDPGYRNIVNHATYATRRRALGSSGTVVWQYGAALDLSPGQSRTLLAKPSDPFIGAIAPDEGTDYTVSGGTATVALTYDSGLSAIITVTATSGSPTISDLQLRATSLVVVSETTIENSVDASASIAKFSPIPNANISRDYAVAGWPEIDPNQAESVCNAWVSRYQTQRPIVTATLRNPDAAHMRQILEREISDRITIVEGNTGLSADVWIETKSIKVTTGGRAVECVLGCEKVEEVAGSAWDAALWDAGNWGS